MMQTELRVERVERRLSVDEVSDAEWLRTQTETGDHGQLRIVSSWRYSDDDVAEYGAAQVSQWIMEDHRRLGGFGRDWCFFHIEAVAVVGVYAADKRIGEVEVRSMGVGGIESDAPKEHLDDLSAEELSELRDELLGYGLTMPADRVIPYSVEKSILQAWHRDEESMRWPT